MTVNKFTYEFEHVDDDASRGVTNMVPALQDAVDFVANRPMGGVVSVGAYAQTGVRPWSGILNVPENVDIEFDEHAGVELTGPTPDMMRCAGNNRIRGLKVDLVGNLTGAILRAMPNASQVHAERLHQTNSGAIASSVVFRIDDGNTSCSIKESFCDRVNRMVWDRGGCTNLRVEYNQATNLGLIAFECGVSGFARDHWILFNRFVHHSDDADAGHMIAYQPVDETSNAYHTNLWVVGNLVEGLPNLANVPGVADGASGDLVAMKHCQLFHVIDNNVRNSGEIGITAVVGSRRGRISDNNIDSTDLAAIAVGAFPSGNTGRETDRITVSDNDCRLYGRDLNTQFRGGPNEEVLSGVLVGDSTRTGVFDNDLDGENRGVYGAHIRSGAQSVRYGRNSMTGHTNDDLSIEPGATVDSRETQAQIPAGVYSSPWQ